MLDNSERLKNCYYTEEAKDLLDRKGGNGTQSRKRSSIKSSVVEKKSSQAVTETKAVDVANSLVQSQLMYLLGGGAETAKLQQLLSTQAPIPFVPCAISLTTPTPLNKVSEITPPACTGVSTTPISLSTPRPQFKSAHISSKERSKMTMAGPKKQPQLLKQKARQKGWKKAPIVHESIKKYFKPTGINVHHK